MKYSFHIITVSLKNAIYSFSSVTSSEGNTYFATNNKLVYGLWVIGKGLASGAPCVHREFTTTTQKIF